MTLGRELDLLQLLLPNRSNDAWSAVTVESSGLPPDTGHESTMAEAAISHRRHGSKRVGNKGEEPRSCGKRRKTKQASICHVTSVPDFDGYQWRKYGQKQIEGAMYPRSYYRCARSAEQRCPAKRTVQRNDDGDDISGSPKYTVVYMAEHTCTADDSTEKPVILETSAVPRRSCGTKNIAAPAAFLPPEAEARYDAAALVDPAAAADSSVTRPASTTVTITGTAESPAISDVTWSGTANNNELHDDLLRDELFAVDHRCAEMSSLLVHKDMDDFTGPIRSPVHIASGDWTVDHLHLLHLVNEPISHSSAGFSF